MTGSVKRRSPKRSLRRSPLTLLLVKVWRDALALRATWLALSVLVMLGVALYITFAQARLNLEGSYKRFYDATHFADATIWVDGAPESLLETVRLIPGVRQVIGRQSKDGSIILRARARRRVTGRFIGLPIAPRSPINDLQVVKGRYLSDRNECLLEQLFARENKLAPGDRITASYLGRKREFLVVGIAASPEYLYPVPSKEASFVSPQTFGVCWIDQDAARQWLSLGNRLTEVHVQCAAGSADNALTVMRSLGERYGLRSYWTQADQPSNHLLSLDIQGFQALSVIFPLLFMLAAALSLHSALTRIVRLQTGVIGFLRASGFSSREVLLHYVASGWLVALSGALPGALLGHGVSVALVGVYQRELNLPVAVTQPHFGVIFSGVAIALGVATAAAWMPARSAANTPPAVAMRGAESTSDNSGAAPVKPWLVTLTARLPVLFRIPARGLLRRPSRTLLAVVGLASGASLLLVSVGMWAAVQASIGELLDEVYRYEVDVSFIAPAGKPLADAASVLPGVDGVYHTCIAVVKAKSLHAEQGVTLMGLQRGQLATRLPKVGGGFADMEPGDLWLSEGTARRLRVEPGDALQLEWAYSSRRKRVKTVGRVRGLLDMGFGGMVFGEYNDMRRRLVDRVYPEGVYGAQILCDRATGEALQRRFERSDLVASVTSIGEIRDQVRQSLKITMLFVGVLVAFSSMLAGAVLHGVSSVGIVERLRELATLRSLGFTITQTGWIAAVEVYAMATLALGLGIPLGIWMNAQFLQVYNTETFTFRPALPWWTFTFVVATVYTLVALSLRSGLKQLRALNLPEATKAVE